jgi:hypothetical protein
MVAPLVTAKTVFWVMRLVDWFMEKLFVLIMKVDVHYDAVFQLEDKEISGVF